MHTNNNVKTDEGSRLETGILLGMALATYLAMYSKDTDKVIKTQERSYDLFVRLHNDVNPGPYTLVHQF